MSSTFGSNPQDGLCRDRTYPTKHLSHLPHVYRLSAGLSAMLDYARESQIPACRQMIQDAAHRGDNVGTDEFNEDLLPMFFALAEMFVVTKRFGVDSPDGFNKFQSENILAFLAIIPSIYARGLTDKVVASLYVFRSAELESDDEAYQSLVRLGVALIPQLELGYTVVAMATAMTRRPEIIRALRAEGFQISVTLPKAVHLAGLGLTTSYIMTKELGLPDRQPRALDDVIAAYTRFTSDVGLLSIPPLPMCTIPFLPRDYVASSGLGLVCRNATEADVPTFYSLMSKAVSLGEGYSAHEFPSMDYFRRLILAGSYCVVFQNLENGDVVGMLSICDSHLSRTQVIKSNESFMLVTEKYRGRGLGGELTNLEIGMEKELGYDSGFNDPMFSNARMFRIISKIVTQVGVIPKGAYRIFPAEERLRRSDGAIGAWEDTMVMYCSFETPSGFKTFSQLCDDNIDSARKAKL